MTILYGDARAVLPTLDDHSVQAVVTSPPYLQQRRYGDDGAEVGLESTVDEYVATLARIFRQVRSVLAADGLLWVNIGDKANGSGGAGGDWTPAPGKRRGGGPGKFRDPAYAEQSYLDVPGALIRRMLDEGWRLRRDIAWDKGREAPEDLRHVGRPRESHERILLFAPGPARSRFYPSMLAETGSVWHFPPGGSGPSHLAPFPDELARRCILASTRPGDLVLDPFSGSGTTVRVAEELGRRGLGIELYDPTSEHAGRLDRTLREEADRLKVPGELVERADVPAAVEELHETARAVASVTASGSERRSEAAETGSEPTYTLLGFYLGEGGWQDDPDGQGNAVVYAGQTRRQVMQHICTSAEFDEWLAEGGTRRQPSKACSHWWYELQPTESTFDDHELPVGLDPTHTATCPTCGNDAPAFEPPYRHLVRCCGGVQVAR